MASIFARAQKKDQDLSESLDSETRTAMKLYQHRHHNLSKKRYNDYSRWKDVHLDVLHDLYTITKNAFPDRTPSFNQFSEFIYLSSKIDFDPYKLRTIQT